ncbi:formimidoylglutamate deiminase [Flavobacterium sp. MAH-1]|uniref:Formimidoylglutamate deiminase n=1 Tax=Flavobacterium agri TaxID=2743471 RepID=A0A7Y8Y527_9FLAO|nr:formimidoylglutamate deiminase [Flavobacterium agri]NUY82664.1 formimidoylglutamate deiminase [Flavobacterium agri]NYA72687.1 formimidoylglutamate deiminase [Flavobacterium agri]
MKTYTFKGLLTENGWLVNASVVVDENGKIASVSQNTEGEKVNGFALPGFQNAHSHAFQYAMAGLAELHEGTGVPDDFWSWRTAMYNLALTISPDQLEDIAAMLYAEMLRHGYTSVAEFHYLHHDKDGKPFANLSEMGERLVAAAKKTGIRITLVPMFYQQGGFGQAPVEKQKRFISETIEDYLKLLEATKKSVSVYDGANWGTGIHSLRAVKPQDAVRLTKEMDQNQPFHIHVSEQLKEIEDCLAFHGKRPVQWLLDNCDVNENYHLVHATHLDDPEVSGIAKSGANVVICPSTEGNLGDGLFRFEAYKNQGGKWSIGTDSHVGLNPFEELRILDYGQRLISHKRTTFYESGKGDSGFNAIKMAWESGRKAMGEQNETFFKVGDSFDAVVMDADSALVATASTKNLCNTFVYSADVSNILGTIVNGNWVAKHGKHLNHDQTVSDFKKTMAQLKSRQ